jgi:hypothetical protein
MPKRFSASLMPLFAVCICATASHGFAIDLETHPGRAIYQKMCLDCHGERGKGVKDKADDPLEGDRTLESLASRIERTMPEDEEHLCVGEDAHSVAEYIYHAFYSEEARARLTPARIELSRLTVPQYRNSVADLILGFRGDIGPANEKGLKAWYYGGRGFNERKEFREQEKPDRYERVDSRIRFDFGDKAPSHEEAKEFGTEEFSVRWEGALFAPETGTYEFIIRTRNGATLWVNENNHNESGRKTIDTWVAPDNEIREETGKVFLVGGRPYPIRLEFFTYKEEKAYIELLWKSPHGVLETIPNRNLSQYRIHESCIVDVPFPADDRSVGYERGTSVSKAWFDSVTTGAAQAADYVVSHIDELAKTKKDDPERAKKIGDFGVQFVERAFRRPLREAERIEFVDQHYKEAKNLEQAVKRLVLFTLTSPRFLYPELNQPKKPDQWTIAARLALNLWDSVPDQRLLNQVKAGNLGEPNQLAQHANHAVWNWRTRSKMLGFFHHWLELERAEDLSKDEAVYPEFSDAIQSDLRTSLNLFLDEAVWGEGSGYRQLLLADYLFLNERLGKLYGHEVKGDFQKVKLDPKRRSGIVTHPFLLSSLAYHNNTSPIHRGVFLTRNIVGMTLKSPPMANEFKEGKFDPSLTMREKVTEMTRAKACMGCHITINPLGFSLENYDGIGRWRTKDRNKPVDPTGDLKTEDGNTIHLTGARDVAEFAAETPSAHQAFLQQLFHHLVKQPVRAYGDEKMDELYEQFRSGDFYIPELMKQIAITAATAESPTPLPVVSSKAAPVARPVPEPVAQAFPTVAKPIPTALPIHEN